MINMELPKTKISLVLKGKAEELIKIGKEIDNLEKRGAIKEASQKIEQWKALHEEIVRLKAQEELEPQLHQNKVEYNYEMGTTLSDIKINADKKLLQVKQGVEVQYNATREYNKLLKETKKEILKKDKEIERMERENQELENACKGGAKKIRELHYRKLGSKLTKGTIGTGVITVSAFFFAPQFAISCAVATGVFGILKAGHMATKIVADNGGVKSTVRDFQQLIPKTKGLAKELASSYLERKGHKLPPSSSKHSQVSSPPQFEDFGDFDLGGMRG
jgi:hypothetical protein